MKRRDMTTRIIRPGEPEPVDVDWLSRTAEERIAAVWELTLLCQAWRQEGAGEPRFNRSVSRVLRAGRCGDQD
jgi:hypothetical protein